MAIDIGALLKLMVAKDISDIHFKADACPALRYHGRMVTATNLQKLSAEDIKGIAYTLMKPEQAAEFEKEMELDMAYSLEGVSRFRVNIFRQRGTIGLTLRVVPVRLRTFEDLNLPIEPLTKLGAESRGLILFSGITGAGKTTTMNSFLNYLNLTYQYRIISIEDPIEFYHPDLKSSVVQREVGHDTKSFIAALKHVLRQDPDVVVIGEMRDLETMQAAISAAETGHLVLSTIHTLNAAQTVERIVDAHPPISTTRSANSFPTPSRASWASAWWPPDGQRRYPATEIMIVNSIVRRHLLDGKISELYKVIEGAPTTGCIPSTRICSGFSARARSTSPRSSKTPPTRRTWP